MKSGWIMLYSSRGNLLKTKRYLSRSDRNEIVISWKNYYEKHFIWYQIGIIPDIDETDWIGY